VGFCGNTLAYNGGFCIFASLFSLKKVVYDIIAQILRAGGHDLYYYTFPSETSNRNYEIDFMLSQGSKVAPIEVKSSGYNTHTSIDRFIQKYSGRISEKYLIYTKDYRKDKDITLLPVFYAQFL
jgi:predicted AAA+ superfamily ATPase